MPVLHPCHGHCRLSSSATLPGLSYIVVAPNRSTKTTRASRRLYVPMQRQGMTSDTMDNGAAAESRLTLVPHTLTKVVHFIRHGEGFHNIGYEQNLDAHLTPFGWHQAAALGEHIQKQQPPLDIQVVVVSPLMRTLETAAGAFGGGAAAEPDAEPLMLRKTGEARVRSAHDAIAKPANLPFVANELCRERMGVNVCDSRRPLHETRAAFPGVDFSCVTSGDEDAWWREAHAAVNPSGEYALGESEHACTLRGIRFLKWLMTRPESRIAVVAHAGFIRHTLSAFTAGLPARAAGDLRRDFANCEMRTLVLTDASGRAALVLDDPLRFPGGRAWKESVAGNGGRAS